MKCPSCRNEVSIDPVDATKSICYICRKRYPSDKVAQYWEEKARIEANRTAVGEEHYRQKEQEAAARQYQTVVAQQQPRYGVPYQPQVQTSPKPQMQPQHQPYMPAQPAYQPQSQPYVATQPQMQQPYIAQQQQVMTQPQIPQQPQVMAQPQIPQQPQAVPQPYVQQPYATPQMQPQQNVYAQPTPYPQQTGYQYPMVDTISKQITGFGIASMCTGIASLLILPFIFATCALVFGIISLVKSSSAMRKKSGMAIAGVIMGGVSLLYWIFTLLTI